MANLTPAELRRYGRHLVLPEVGPAGQETLRAARVLVVGLGGLGSPASLYLAAAGVGALGLVDFDVVDESNLQRQILYGESDLGRSKVEAAVARLRDTNPFVVLEPRGERFGRDNALDLVSAHDLVVDGSDNYPTRYLLNDACVLAGKPFVYGSILRFEGQVSLFADRAAGGPCYRCLFPEPPPVGAVPSCAEAGVLGLLPGVIGSLQAAEAVKWLLGIGRTLVGRLVVFDALGARFREVVIPRDPGCAACGDRPTIHELVEMEDVCLPETRDELTATELDRLRRSGPAAEPLQLLDVRNPIEIQIAPFPGACVIPLPELPSRVGELDPARPTVVLCHVGARSAMAAEFLRRGGFARVWNLQGGIDAWSVEVDPAVPRY